MGQIVESGQHAADDLNRLHKSLLSISLLKLLLNLVPASAPQKQQGLRQARHYNDIQTPKQPQKTPNPPFYQKPTRPPATQPQ
jgi:hypothetical protein